MKELEKMLGINTGSLTALLIDVGIRIAITLAILIIGFWIAKVLSKAIVKVLKKRGADDSLVSFIRSLTSIGLKVLVLITAMSELGVEMTSFVAILGAAGLSIGLAFSGTLSNFAGGVMILLFKPFKVGDYVNMQGEEGTVKEILIFNTILTTLDNKIIILANGAVANGTVTNFTKAEKRRVDWVFGIAYGDDLKVAKVLLDKFISEDERILKEGANFIGVGELGDSSVNITVRAWVKTEDYWNVFFAMNERVYNEFGNAGLSIPFPQMDVHMQKEG
ncbi:mechanosensitive ion channel [Crocinitomicaceae bacterium]|nr:mechanosensitive ion channel [Crocinitomicaceae bacterium]MDC0100512.1 mechanosensitive ion channel [Crocinitomicaceae bacterium]MDC1282992.1 mechanosensitive ion channel [Crocinitomicaceae bacterium]|tara:strand:+ start:12569 stop:13399 length:831 start_codon:yes stop_codon:yes gene_type:complete